MPPRNPVFLDANAGAPLHPRVVEALRAAAGSQDFPELAFSNPSAVHAFGRRSRMLLSEARGRVALSLGPSVRPDDVFFASSGTEANQWVIRSSLGDAASGAHWVLSSTEHPSVALAADEWRRAGGSVTTLRADRMGLIDPAELEAALRPETRLVSLIWVNNETGVVSPVVEAGRICRSRGVPLHLDGAQAWGKIPLVEGLNSASHITFSSHKIGAPSGLGIVVTRTGAPKLKPWIVGAQERAIRGGTENLLGIWLTGVAAEACDPLAFDAATRPHRDRFEDALQARIPGLRIHGRGARRVTNTVSLSVAEIGAFDLVPALDLEGYCVSAGSACSAGTLKPSRVLLAMGIDAAQATATARVSFGTDVRPEELEGFVTALEKIVLRAGSRHPGGGIRPEARV
ncbi:MAG: cysteine desulfurase [Bdellovibrionales bacterium]|nr:cysteine desulfurase [Bdellovibrionales bacterium]